MIDFLKHFPFSKPRPEQTAAIEFAMNAFLKEDKRFVILEMGTGCHRVNQKILMHNGHFKLVQNIVEGDCLMGPDSRPRKVKSLVRGVGEMVKVVPVKGEPFVVNIDHILTLARTNKSSKESKRKDCKDGEVVDVSVREWLEWSKKKKHLYKLVRSAGIEFDRQKQLPIDPYFLGVLLGDGSVKKQIAVTTQNQEIVDEVYSQATNWDLDIREESKKDSKAKTYCFTSRHKKSKNSLLKELRLIEIWGLGCQNKKVPFIYKSSSQKSRLEVLAGLIDTDGHLHGNCYDYISKSKMLSCDVAFLCRSVGLAAYVSECQKKSQNGTVGTYYRVSISGDTNRIPVRILEKKASNRQQKKSVIRTGFSVEILQEPEPYYGFVVDGDRRYLMDDFTITHNCGKSGVGITLGRLLAQKKFADFEKGAWFLTTQKILQDQYVGDFGPPRGGMCSVKSSSNYQCEFFRHQNCGEARQLLKNTKKGSPFFKKCMNGCVYKRAKEDFIKANESATNFPYFLTETAYVGKIKPRNLLVIDEAHSIEAELSSFIEITISELFAKKVLKIDFPRTKSQKQAIAWVRGEYVDALNSCIEKHSRELSNLDEKLDEAKKLAARVDKLETHRSKISKFLELYNSKNWVFNRVSAEGQGGRKFEFKPIDVGAYADSHLFGYGNKVLMMSATILNKDAFCESIGIDPKDAAFISIPSPFPVENRPIHYLPAGKMNMREIEKTLPKMAQIVSDILEAHPDEKGIIHCRTFKIARYIKEHVKSKRLLVHSTDDREKIINKHMESKEPTVLVSPSSTEGLDLKGDLGRFQVVCKIYWPYMGDELVKARMEKYDHWYAYQAAKTMIQSLGRSIRNEEDYAVSYILDESWDYFYVSNKELFPDYFRKSLHM